MCWLWPRRIPGRPGTVTPLTAYPGADSATWYQIDGMVCGRCGSPASIDPPPATAGPSAAHALLSGSVGIWPAGRALTAAGSAAAAVAWPADTCPGPAAGPVAGTVLANTGAAAAA